MAVALMPLLMTQQAFPCIVGGYLHGFSFFIFYKKADFHFIGQVSSHVLIYMPGNSTDGKIRPVRRGQIDKIIHHLISFFQPQQFVTNKYPGVFGVFQFGPFCLGQFPVILTLFKPAIRNTVIGCISKINSIAIQVKGHILTQK